MQVVFPLVQEVCELIAALKYAIVSSKQRFEDCIWPKRALSLSAPQLGHPSTLFILAQPANIGTAHQYRGYRTIINPAITWKSPGLYEDWEGCLSVPKVHAMVRRHRKVRVQYWTPEGERVEYTLSGLVGRVRFRQIFQHEIDHFHGKMMLDKALRTEPIPPPDDLRAYRPHPSLLNSTKHPI